jgi:hypothetical protein
MQFGIAVQCGLRSRAVPKRPVQLPFIAAVILFRRHLSLVAVASTSRERNMRSIVLSAALLFGLATAASAAGFTPVPIGANGGLVIKVAEGCGAGWWRGPEGHCHPMAVGRACPPGYHLGPEGKKCWPN